MSELFLRLLRMYWQVHVMCSWSAFYLLHAGFAFPWLVWECRTCRMQTKAHHRLLELLHTYAGKSMLWSAVWVRGRCPKKDTYCCILCILCKAHLNCCMLQSKPDTITWISNKLKTGLLLQPRLSCWADDVLNHSFVNEPLCMYKILLYLY